MPEYCTTRRSIKSKILGKINNNNREKYLNLGIGSTNWKDFSLDSLLQNNFYPSIGARLLEYCSMDVVFVAIDFEGLQQICPGRSTSNLTTESRPNGQVGIAILDTRDLNKPPETAVTTRQFCVGAEWYCETVPLRLLFGTSETLTGVEELKMKMTELLRFADPTTNKLRPIVVIGHDLDPNSYNGDIGCLDMLTDPTVRSPIIDYLDTTSDRTVLLPLGFTPNPGRTHPDEWATPSLRMVLEYLAIPYANLHIAANDAVFALRAAIMVAVRGHQATDRDLTSAEHTHLSGLRDIALLPVPRPPGVKQLRLAWGGSSVGCFARRMRKHQERQEFKHDRIKHHKDRQSLADWTDLSDGLFGLDFDDAQTTNPDGEAVADWTDLSDGLFCLHFDEEHTTNADGESLQDPEHNQPAASPDAESLSNPETSDTEDSFGCMYFSDEESE